MPSSPGIAMSLTTTSNESDSSRWRACSALDIASAT